jgi:hypothetical protein
MRYLNPLNIVVFREGKNFTFDDIIDEQISFIYH